MKTIVIYLAKKYIISAVNDMLKKYKEDVSKVTLTIDTWIQRLLKVIAQLKAINERVSDGEITTDEIKLSSEEIEKLVKEF